jgi:hypothetical protein
MFSGAMGFGCLVELWALDVLWSYWPWMFGGAMGLGFWWNYGRWMFGGAMCLGYLVELWALDVWWSYGL